MRVLLQSQDSKVAQAPKMCHPAIPHRTESKTDPCKVGQPLKVFTSPAPLIRVRHEVKRREFGQALEVYQAIIGHFCGVEVDYGGCSGRVRCAESGIGHSGVTEQAQFLQVGQILEMRQAGIAYTRGPQDKTLEVGQAFQVGQPLIAHWFGSEVDTYQLEMFHRQVADWTDLLFLPLHTHLDGPLE